MTVKRPVAPVNLPEPQRTLLSALDREPGQTVSFQGLRRSLDVHPEHLKRTLRRLERSGHVRRTPEGYQSTATAGNGLEVSTTPRSTARQIVACAMLPPGSSRNALAEQMAHRWFRDLRWYGRTDRADSTTLTWNGPHASTWRIHLAGPAACVEVETDDQEVSPEWTPAGPLLGALAESYSKRLTAGASPRVLEASFSRRAAA